MKLHSLLSHFTTTNIIGFTSENAETKLTGVAYDSRKVKPGFVFVAIKGKNHDGHAFIPQALKNGASLIIVEDVPIYTGDTVVMQVINSRQVLADVSQIWFDSPSRKMHLIGITGTNGKTSVSWFLYDMLRDIGNHTGIIGTIDNQIDGESLPVERNTPTTPESLELQTLLNTMVEKGVDDVIMEVSSKALDSHRVDGCQFAVGIYTNLTQDHLDDHGTMEAYKAAKLKLFPKCLTSIINLDDPYAADVMECSNHYYTYGTSEKADFRARDISVTMNGVHFVLEYKSMKAEIEVGISGEFTVYNILAAIATCHSLGLPWGDILTSIPAISGVKGRMQPIHSDKGFTVIVDYAHSPDALENVLKTVKSVAKERVISIFGCGGDRDPSKREPMGQIAGILSDYIYLTSDNPRTEKPMEILRTIQKGVVKTETPYEIVEDRKTAIEKAISQAKEGDIVVIAGKGHETYQIIGDKTYDFDDAEIANEFIQKKGSL
ncbi:UDP-N-acetylmuramoyl-L-alanyl-D-glutamate--2,6-diaminopimelate ligase [Bacillus luti]|nr:UDP-N-acetylmuramoyl-L-alanyl-D-glutamate--2,6-diaminopimelate ligase 2 [Bacillus cereus]